MNKKIAYFKDSKNLDKFFDFADRNVYIEQNFEQFKRLIIWPSQDAIRVIKRFAEVSEGPYCIEYLLNQSSEANRCAKYAICDIRFETLCQFLYGFKDFFECDGRHRLMVQAVTENNNYFVYNQDNFIFAYGNTQLFKKLLHILGFEEYNKPMILPDPHVYMFHQEFNSLEQKVLSSFNWSISPLGKVRGHIG